MPLVGEIPANITGWRAVDLVWTLDDSHRADREGWNIFESDTHGLEIERDDEEAIFPNDETALTHCIAMAEVSQLHAKALAIHFYNLAERRR